MPKKVFVPDPSDELLTIDEACAILFGVTAPTLRRWENEGRMGPDAVIRTPSGHRRYRATAIRDLRANAASGEGALGGGRG